jgi:hypothetical protein
MLTSKKKLKILDFDIENRPLSYWYDGRPTAETTAIAHCWSDDIRSMEVGLLGHDDPLDILGRFLERYNEADMVTGHYIRGHDLPIINGGLIEYGLPILGPKMTSDTRNDLPKKGDIPATQEFLSELFELPLPKIGMSQVKWRKSNRLTEEGIRFTKERAEGDVFQHILLRNKLLELGLLKGPKMWRS